MSITGNEVKGLGFDQVLHQIKFTPRPAALTFIDVNRGRYVCLTVQNLETVSHQSVCDPPGHLCAAQSGHGAYERDGRAQPPQRAATRDTADHAGVSER